MVSDTGLVDWRSVWVIASEDFVDDLNLSLGGPMESSPEAKTPVPRPGWARSVNMADATTGKFVLG